MCTKPKKFCWLKGKVFVYKTRQDKGITLQRAPHFAIVLSKKKHKHTTASFRDHYKWRHECWKERGKHLGEMAIYRVTVQWRRTKLPWRHLLTALFPFQDFTEKAFASMCDSCRDSCGTSFRPKPGSGHGQFWRNVWNGSTGFGRNRSTCFGWSFWKFSYLCFRLVRSSTLTIIYNFKPPSANIGEAGFRLEVRHRGEYQSFVT